MDEVSTIKRHDIYNSLPYDRRGKLSREAIVEHLKLNPLFASRFFITNFAGSRPGNDPAYVQEALRYSELSNDQGIGVTYGGMPERKIGDNKFGCMNACSYYNESIFACSPSLFADGKKPNDGLDQRAVNVVVHDFYYRKVIFDLYGHRSVAHAGGFGTLEEILEALIFAAQHGRMVDLINVKGYWDSLVTQLHVLRSVGLLEQKIMDLFTLSPTAEIAFGHAERHFRAGLTDDQVKSVVEDENRPTRNKPRVSLTEFMQSNTHFVGDAIFSFLPKHLHKASRIGVVVSGNISSEMDYSMLKDERLTKTLYKQAQTLGEETAKMGAILVLSGHRAGLRDIMAKAASDAGGHVIWVQRGHVSHPCEVKILGKELTFTVAREFEKNMLFDLLCHATGFLPGGIRTLDRIFSIVTRHQTGFGLFNFLLNDRTIAKDKCRTVGYNTGMLWSNVSDQVQRFIKDKFVDPSDEDLFQMLDDKQNLAAAIFANAREMTEKGHDLLQEIAALPRRPTPLEATVQDPRYILSRGPGR